MDAYVIWAEVYADRPDWSALDGILAEAAKEVPDDLTPQYRAAERLLDMHRDPARAERYFRTYLGQEPEGNEPRLAEVHWKLGLALESEGHDNAAIEEWREALRLDPESPARRDLKNLRTARSATAGRF